MAKKYSDPTKVSEKEKIKLDVTEKSKEDRGKIHRSVQDYFKHLVSCSNTLARLGNRASQMIEDFSDPVSSARCHS